MNDNAARMMLENLSEHMGLVQWIDCYAVGTNGGGQYVAFFSSRLNYRICTAYKENFYRLPKYIDLNNDAGDVSGTREQVEKMGALISCPGTKIIRHLRDGNQPPGKDNPWKFGGVLFIKQQPAPPAQPSTPQRREPPASAPPVPSQQPAPRDVETCTAGQRQRIDKLARALFDNWDQIKDQWVKSASKGAALHIHELTPAEADRLTAAIEYMMAAKLHSGAEAGGLIAKQIAWAAEQNGEQYRLAVEMPLERLQTFFSAIMGKVRADESKANELAVLDQLLATA